jgi:hypothetical protein
VLFVRQTDSFGGHLLAGLKAFVLAAFLVYEAFGALVD